MGPRNPDDRRKFVRYAMKTDVYLVFRPAFDRLGTLKDVSLSGAAFEYAIFDHHRELDEIEEIDIFTSQPDHFMLRQVPCRVVYDMKVERSSLSGLESWRCGVKFEGLTPPQRQQLKQLIAKHASHPLQSKPTGTQGPLPTNHPSAA